MGRPTILLGTSEFAAKAGAELQAGGLPESRFVCVPQGAARLPEEAFTALVHDVMQRIVSLLGSAP
jgi:hypothetical protein